MSRLNATGLAAAAAIAGNQTANPNQIRPWLRIFAKRLFMNRKSVARPFAGTKFTRGWLTCISHPGGKTSSVSAPGRRAKPAGELGGHSVWERGGVVGASRRRFATQRS